MIRFLAWKRPDTPEGLILAVQGTELLGGQVPIPSPDVPGFAVWQGESSEGTLVGEWRRATARDMEDFGVPLSEPTASPGFCCAMRRRFLVKVVAVDQSVPVPPEFSEFAGGMTPQGKFVLQARYCQWCGSLLQEGDVTRIVT